MKGTGKANGNTKDPCEGPRNFRQPRSLQRMLEIVSILFKSRTTHRLYPSETEGRTYEHIPPRNQISSYRYIRLDSEIAYRASCLLGPVLGPQEIPDCPAPVERTLQPFCATGLYPAKLTKSRIVLRGCSDPCLGPKKFQTTPLAQKCLDQ